MAVPDWPTSYGYNMFFLPIKFWNGGIFYEHTHRLWASVVGLLVVGLTRWLGGHASRRPLAMIGLIEVLAGLWSLGVQAGTEGRGHFLAGIGGAVLAASAIWARNPPARTSVAATGLARLRPGAVPGRARRVARGVVLRTRSGFSTRRWRNCFSCWSARSRCSRADGGPTTSRCARRGGLPIAPAAFDEPAPASRSRPRFLIFGQLILGATMRHQHAGLAIPDFPLAYGKLWPAMDAASGRALQPAARSKSRQPIRSRRSRSGCRWRIGWWRW